MAIQNLTLLTSYNARESNTRNIIILVVPCEKLNAIIDIYEKAIKSSKNLLFTRNCTSVLLLCDTIALVIPCRECVNSEKNLLPLRLRS
jgi:hypothetical protein